MQLNAENLKKNLIELSERWARNSYLFVKEALGVEKVTSQQKEACEKISFFVNARIKKWNGEQLTEEETHACLLKGISIMSGKGTGKDAWLSWMVLWFLCCFSNSKIPLTGPSRDQMRDVLMAEIAKWANRVDEEGNPKFLFREFVVIQADKVYMKDPDNPNSEGKDWFARLRTAPKNASEEMQAKNMDGLHEDFMMIGVDEADGVRATVLTSLETTLTGPVNFMLLIFNPTKNYGYAYETHYDRRSKYWYRIHWDARKSENVSQDQIQYVLDTYGEESPEYRVNVCGYPPEQTPDTLIPQKWIDEAKDRDITPERAVRVMGVDPSRQGGDPAGIIIRDNFKFVDFLEFKKLDTVELADQIAHIFIEWECDLMFIDIIGNGAGVYDLLQRRFPGKVRGIDVSTKPKDNRKKFNRLRDELWWKVRTVFERQLVSVPTKHRLHKKFCNELAVMKREPADQDMTGKIKIETKAKMKSRGVRSPNLADAFMVSLAAPDGAFKPVEKSKGKKDPYDVLFDELMNPEENFGWMGL